eukprot:8037395-Lingulodinium_polyedra.AAC.1
MAPPPPPPPGRDFFRRSSSTEPTTGDAQWTRGMTGRRVRISVPQASAGASWTEAVSAAGSMGAGLPVSAAFAPPGITPFAQELRAVSSYTKRCP